MIDSNDPKGAMSGRDKTSVALAAAIGGGCRTCAEKLASVARAQNMSDDEIAWAFAQGLAVRQDATDLMREQVRALTGRTPRLGDGPGTEPLGGLMRLAAAVAANAAPEALRHVEAAKAAGAVESAAEVAAAIGRSIRAKAQGFSDEEISAFDEADVVGSGCGERASPCCRP